MPQDDDDDGDDDKEGEEEEGNVGDEKAETPPAMVALATNWDQ